MQHGITDWGMGPAGARAPISDANAVTDATLLMQNFLIHFNKYTKNSRPIEGRSPRRGGRDEARAYGVGCPNG
jgi:hypothetical protein